MSNGSSMTHETQQDDEPEIVMEGSSFVHGGASEDDKGPPKVDSQVEILHEKVTKQIIKEGHGVKPSKYSTCFCKFPVFMAFFFNKNDHFYIFDLWEIGSKIHIWVFLFYLMKTMT